jgi:hypothetical protein
MKARDAPIVCSASSGSTTCCITGDRASYAAWALAQIVSPPRSGMSIARSVP